MIAIIASLVVISCYVALRFDWKFAVPVLIALMHDLLITSGVYALTGRVVTTDTVAALLTILGYSMYDTIIVFDRVRENVPRMPRAAFSQIVNRSMSEVLTRSLATTTCTLLPVIALLLFGGTTLKNFAFALLIGVASGAYSSIFIASPVLMHWKEREPQIPCPPRADRRRLGPSRRTRRAAPTSSPSRPAGVAPGGSPSRTPETVSAAEFEADEAGTRARGGRSGEDLDAHAGDCRRRARTATPPRTATSDTAGGQAQGPDPACPAPPAPPSAPATERAGGRPTPAERRWRGRHRRPDIAENDGMAPEHQPAAPKGRSRNRKHGRR